MPARDRRSAERAAFGPTLALTVTLALAGFALVMSVVILAVDPIPIPPRGELGEQRQDAETALYLVAFFVVLPLAVYSAPRLADRIAAGPNGPALGSLAALLAAGFAAAVVAARLADLLWGGGAALVLAGSGVWSLAAAASLARSARSDASPGLLRLERYSEAAWWAAAALALGALLGLTSTPSIDPAALAIGVAAVAAALAGYRSLRLPRPSGRWGVLVDVAIAGIVFAAVPDLVVFQPELAASDSAIGFETAIIQFHQNFLLGPANEVLAGGAVLVDTASQYGVGPIYLLAGWLELIPAGYGAFALLDGLLTALLYVSAYALLRLAGVSRTLAAAALAVAVVVLVFNLPYSVGGLPEQGPLRFGLPMIVIVAAVAGARRPGLRRPGWAIAIGTVALASVWAFESLVYTLATFAGVASVEAWSVAAPERLRWALRQAILLAAACIAAHLLFAAATLAAAGDLPDWGQYLAFLRGFLFGKLGEVTYDVSEWSPGLAVGAGYMASAAGLALLAGRRPDVIAAERPAAVALAGTTAYGIVLLSYFVDRSGDGILAYVALPALLTATLWLAVVLRVPQTAGLPRVRLGALALALAVALLAVATAWSSVGERFPRSALAHLPPRGKSLRDAVDRLRHPPPLSRRAPAGESLLDRYLPDRRRVLILTVPDLGVEILLRSGRANELPFSDPIEDSFVAEEHLPDLREAVAEIEPGARILLDETALEALAELRSRAAGERLGEFTAIGSLAPLQRRALELIDARFELRPIHRESIYTVAELAPRG